jgi:addiction module HigA family antidote
MYKEGDELPLITPGFLLMEEFMKPFNLSINELARQLHVSPTAISEIVRGKRAISTSMAARLGRFFKNSQQMWLNLQQSYEVSVFDRTSEPIEIALQVVPFNYDMIIPSKNDNQVAENVSTVVYKKRTKEQEAVAVKKVRVFSGAKAPAAAGNKPKKTTFKSGKKS